MENRRENVDWIQALSTPGPAQDSALEELRRILLGGLARAFPQQNSASVEDAVQISLVKVLAHLGSFAGESRFTTWAMSIAVRTALSDLRSKRWQHVSLEEMAGPANASLPEALASKDDPARSSVRKNLIVTLHELVEHTLTPKQRAAILAEVGGMPLEEIAVRLGSNLNAVYKMLHDARKRLKTALEGKGIFQEDVAQIFSL